MNKHQKIKAEANGDYWICTCGNTPRYEGFFPCDSRGKKVEPTIAEWTTDCYVCDKCGNIINHKTLNIVGKRKF